MNQSTSPTHSKIVFLDDDGTVLDLISRALRNTDTTFMCFQNPAQAIKYIAANRPDVIVLDYLMPLENGTDILMHLINSGWSSSRNFIWSSVELPASAHNMVIELGATPILKQELFEQGFVDRLCKPGIETDSVNCC